MKRVRKAVIPAGGFGTRLLPATKVIPKEMLPVVDKPLIQFIIEEVAQAGIEEVILITGREKGSIEDHFDSSAELELFLEKKNKPDLLDLIRPLCNLVHIVSVRQPYPMGLGHAILCAKNLLRDEPFAVLLPDDLIISQTPCIAQLLEVYEKYQQPVIAIQRVPQDETSSYGIIKPQTVGDGLHSVLDLIEKPSVKDAPSDLAVIGRYILPPEIFAHLDKTFAGVGGEIQLTDALRALLPTTPILGLEYEGTRFDAGNRAGFIKANLFLGLRNPEIREELLSFIKDLDIGNAIK
jgi:UTP--glucose-1-phosphate uridylyltransferase